MSTPNIIDTPILQLLFLLLQALNNWGLVLQELSTMRAEAERDRLVRQSVVRHPFLFLIRKSLFAKLTYCDMWHATFYAKIFATSALLQPGQCLPDAHPERDDTLIMVVLIRPGLCRLFLAVSRCFTLRRIASKRIQ